MTACLQVGKEKLSYRKEADQQKLKLQKMKDDGKDEHDVKKMGEVRGGSKTRFPDSTNTLTPDALTH